MCNSEHYYYGSTATMISFESSVWYCSVETGIGNPKWFWHIESGAVTWRDVPFDMCVHWRHKSAWASAQYDKYSSLHVSEILQPWLSSMRPVKVLIRLRECAVWSESSLDAHVRRYVFYRCGSNLPQYICTQQRLKPASENRVVWSGCSLSFNKSYSTHMIL